MRTTLREEVTPTRRDTAASEAHLPEIYAPCLALILQLRNADEFGDPAVLRQRIKGLLDQSERSALRAEIGPSEIRMAKFAVVAFLDETILASSWRGKSEWVAKPLQLELYDRYDAGEEFFVRLDQLREQPSLNADVLEVYYLCMALGFKGKYQLYHQEQLRMIIEEVAGMLRSDREGLSPHGRPVERVTSEVKNMVPSWIILLVAVGIGILAYLGMFWYMSSIADDTADDIRKMTTAQVRFEAAPTQAPNMRPTGS